jgi:hypothetical protein
MKPINKQKWVETDGRIFNDDFKFVCDCMTPDLDFEEIVRNMNTIKHVPTMINALLEAEEIMEMQMGSSCFAIESVLEKIGIEAER